MVLSTSAGHEYDLSPIAVAKLQKAKNGRDAEEVFNRFAAHGKVFWLFRVSRRNYVL